MPETPDLWRQRYQLAIETHERSVSEHRELVQQLCRAINRVAIGCRGQDATLDAELDGLRAFLKLKNLSTDVLASKIDVVEEHLRKLEERPGGADPRLIGNVRKLVEQLGDARPPREVQRALDALGKKLRGNIEGDALVLLDLAVTLQAQVLAAANIAQPARQAAAQGTDPAGDGVLRRVFGGILGRGATTHAEADAPPGAPAEPPPPLPLDEAFAQLSTPVSKALDALLDTVSPPQADTVMQAVYEGAKMRATRGLRRQELVPAVEESRVLAAAALSRSRDEFEYFLQQLNQRLGSTAAVVEGGQSRLARREASRAELESRMQDGVSSIRAQLGGAHDLERLKLEVSGRIEGIGKAVDAYRAREEQLREESKAATVALGERVAILQQQTAEAETRIAEQRRLALTDSLTQLPNREAWAQRLKQEYERWRRYGRPLALAVCDVDRFKSVNDQHGHAVGDAVLREIAARVRGALREADFVARFGGEEFVILLPESDATQAARAMDTVRRAINGKGVNYANGSSLTVTASFGVAAFAEGDSTERVFTRADAALYQAKSAGRDRVQIYGAPDAPPE